MKKKLKYAPLKKKRLYEEVADQLKKTIFKGDLEPGDQLPPERELSEMFNVGRPTIREALRTLSVLGLIDSNPGFKGSIVKKVDLSQYLDAMSEQFAWMIQADEQSFEQMSEARKYIELGIAHAVAQQADEKDFAELERDLDTLETMVNDPKKYLEGGENWFTKVFSSDYEKLIYDQKYELMRFWLLGTWIAKQSGKEFYLINLVLQYRELNIHSSFLKHIRIDSKYRYFRLSWEDIYRFVLRDSTDNALKTRVVSYFENKAIGFNYYGSLEKAFSI